MRTFLLAAVSLLAFSVSAQKKNKAAEQFSKTITANDLKTHLYILAAPEMEGRETGTAGQRKAAEYLKEQFQRIGIAPANNGNYEQFYPLYKDTLKDAAVSVNSKNYEFGKDFSAALNSIITTQQFFSEVVYMSKVDTTTDIRGKAVVIVAKNGTQLPAFNDINKLYSRQPAAVLFVVNNIDKQPSPRGGRLSFSLYRSRQNPMVVRVSEAMGEALLKSDFAAAKAQTLETKTVATELMLDFRKETEITQASNVLGMIEGTDKKDEWIVISAHYDHVGIIGG